MPKMNMNNCESWYLVKDKGSKKEGQPGGQGSHLVELAHASPKQRPEFDPIGVGLPRTVLVL